MDTLFNRPPRTTTAEHVSRSLADHASSMDQVYLSIIQKVGAEPSEKPPAKQVLDVLKQKLTERGVSYMDGMEYFQLYDLLVGDFIKKLRDKHVEVYTGSFEQLYDLVQEHGA